MTVEFLTAAILWCQVLIAPSSWQVPPCVRERVECLKKAMGAFGYTNEMQVTCILDPAQPKKK